MSNYPKKSFILKKYWDKHDQDIWLATKINFFRNLNKFLFPAKLDPYRREQVLNITSSVLLKSSYLKKPTFHPAEELDPISKEFLYEHFLGHNNFYQAHTGEGFIIDKTAQFLAIINVKNHLQLHVIDNTDQLEKTWNLLTNIEHELSKQLDFSFSSKFGFLTSNPTVSGTGLTISTFLHVPALIFSEKTLDHYQNNQIKLCSLTGESDNFIGDVVIIYNHYSNGSSEKNILKQVRTLATKITVDEKRKRQYILSQTFEQEDKLKDLICRNYGLLKHSYSLDTIECMQALSLCKLAFSLGYLKGKTLSNKTFNRLMLYCRRAHLCKKFNITDTKDLALCNKIRAEMIHKKFKFTQLSL